ncbi:nuclear factor 7, ovary-like [Engraulis encrasicolus]|uniref:nuclear factor 7, ovary-like n=1 Tax=Engraulis encrasicolus TaxID=184585 RepID=UPI002FCF4E9E
MDPKAPALLEEELTCPICTDFFHDPVGLGCQHNFCRSCLTKAWEQQKDSDLSCPTCRRKRSRDLVPNMTLRNIVEAFLLEKATKEGRVGGQVCAKHHRKLRYFCKERSQVLCGVCVEKGQHGLHTYQTIVEATDQLKTDLVSVMEELQTRLGSLEEMRGVSEHVAQHIKTQGHNTEGQIRREFAQLRQFLKEEEEARLAAVRLEEQQKTVPLMENLQRLSRQISSLNQEMENVRSVTGTEDITFLQMYKDQKESALQRLKEPVPKQISGSLIDVARHLFNLKLSVWEKMQKMVQYTPVCLDENTAHPDLLISGSLSEVRDGQASHPLPDNPERFDSTLGVLGSPGFLTGTHTWQVEVGCQSSWVLGVAREGVARKGVVNVNPEAGLWAVGLSNGKDYSAGTATVGTTLSLKRHPERVVITLDCDNHCLSFYDAEGMSPIHTFKDVDKEGMLYPYFSPCLNTDGENLGMLRICPGIVTVSCTSNPI